MEGDRDSLSDSYLETANTDCVAEQKPCTVLDDESVSSPGKEKQDSGSSSFSAGPGVQMDKTNENNRSFGKISAQYDSVVEGDTDSETLTQQDNAKGRTGETIGEREDQECLHVSSSQQEAPADIHQTLLNEQPPVRIENRPVLTADLLSETDRPCTQSFALTERKSDEDGKTSNLSETDTGSSVDPEICVKNSAVSENNDASESDNHNRPFALGKEITTNESEHERISMLQTTGQLQTESKDESPDLECQMEQKGKVSSDSLVEHSSPSSILNSIERQKQSLIKQSEIKMKGQTFDEQPTASEARTGSGFLSDVILSSQSPICTQTDTDKDTVKISRAELTLMVEQNLAARTMYNYVQNLQQENNTLNRQNEELKDTIVQRRKLEGKDEEREKSTSLPVVSQGTEAQVFCFSSSLPPPIHVQSPSSPSPLLSQQTSRQKSGHTEQTDTGSLVQADGDLTSSVQLSSQIYLDGDNSLNREASAAGKTPPYASNNAASGASAFDQAAPQLNIPHDTLLAGAHSYSSGPQQHEENVAGSAVVSHRQFQLQTDQLEKIMLFMKKVSQDGGIDPNGLKELVHLREKIQSLQEENSRLNMELQNKPLVQHLPGQNERALQLKIRELEEKINDQKKREHELLALITKLGTEKLGGARPLSQVSQPSSTVGLQALPHIQPIQSHTVSCQTDNPYVSIDEHTTQMASLKETMKHHQQAFQTQLEKMKQQLFQSVQILNQHLQELTTHRNELAQQITALNMENDEQKRKLLQESERIKSLSQEAERNRRELERNKELEKMIEDERRRYSHDEKELLDQVKDLNRSVALLRRLALDVDRARVESCPLSQDCASLLADLHRQERRNAASVRAALGRVSGPPSSSMSPQYQNVAHAGQAGPVPQRGGSQQGRGAQSGHSGGRGSRASAQATAPPSLPAPLTRQQGEKPYPRK
ncbi:uncharacterized protein LOC143292898 isoform X2 [Babylonia areolata]|uniref:uncharacterized protein LOC143292898 isoform X2 n=1 Tax=Babylonia areolata TaxID=304850 RepID=UPI003FD3374B